MKTERVFFHRYLLKSAASLNAASTRREHEGALLRIGDGFAGLQTWPELGDPTLAECFAKFRRGEKVALVERALACAKIDGAARREGRSLFSGKLLPLSHATFTEFSTQKLERAQEAGFQVVKLKVGRDWPQEKRWLAEAARRFPEFRWRLDFNFTGQRLALEKSDWESLAVDFLEDPFPYEAGSWGDFQKKTGLDLALDRALDRGNEAAVRVVKPATQDTQKLANAAWGKGQRVVVTNYLDHPLAQCFAAYEAALAAEKGAVSFCGLQTHHLYERTEFSERLGEWRPEFTPPGGTGLGFDDLLENLPWQELT